jgi:signal transduction histidine kinase
MVVKSVESLEVFQVQVDGQYPQPVYRQSGAKIGGNTVGELYLHTYRVDVEDEVQTVIDLLMKYSEIPGVLVEQDGIFVGMISREKCFEQLGRPFGVEVFARRSVAIMLESLPWQALILEADRRIEEAVYLALTREPQCRYEPIIVRTSETDFALLHIHDLLLAQSQQLATANRMVQQQIEVVRAISSTLQLDEVLALILEKMALIIPYERAALMMRYGERLEYAAGVGYPPEVNPAGHLSDLNRHPLFRRIVDEGKPIVVDDMSQQGNYAPPPGLMPTGAWLGLPLLSGERVSGLLSISRVYGQEFQPEELTLASAFADQAAVALENVRLFEETRRFNHELELKVRERTEELQVVNDRLTQLDHTKNELIYVISNELWHPINSIGVNVQTLNRDVDFRVRPKMSERLKSIAENVNRLQHIIASMIDVARLNQNTPRMVNLGSLLNSLTEYFIKLVQDKKIHLISAAMEDLPQIHADQEGMRKVFYQLLLNAVKFTPDGGEIRLSGCILRADQNPLGKDAVRITIADTGIGIAREKQDLIFARFYQNSQEPTVKESGLGLAIVRGIVEGHKGLVTVESSGYDEINLPGSKFHVLLPV